MHTMEKRAQYQPVINDDARSSSEGTEDASLLDPEFFQRRNSRNSVILWVKIGVAVVALALYTALIFGVGWREATILQKHNRRYGQRWLTSPADEFIEYEPRIMEQWEDPNKLQYFGEPSEEIDRNWHNLFEPQNIGLTPELMKELGRDTHGIQLPDGTYYGSMMVFHHLHCLKNVQHALHPKEWRLDTLGGHNLEMHKEHTDHCLHMLMDAVMCQADPTLITMYWQDSMLRPGGDMSSPHECVNWSKFMDWVVPNSKNLFGDGVLTHPKFGPLFQNGRPTQAFNDSIKAEGFGKLAGGE